MIPKKLDIHNFKGRYESSVNRLKTDKILSLANRQLILDYVTSKQNKGIIGIPRAVKLIETLKQIAKIIKKDLSKLTIKDRDKILSEVNQRDYSEWTRSDYKVVLKTFLKDTQPKNIDLYDFKARIKKRDIPKIEKSQLLSLEEIDLLLKACESMRDKAMVSLLWETGARISELGNMRIKNIDFGDEETTVNLAKGKTGTRTVFVIESTPLLAMWLKQHPNNDDPNSPLWVNLGRYGDTKYEAIGYRTFYKNLKRIFERAGIKKKYNPHLFRHSRATFLAQRGQSQQQLNKFFGWEADSTMASIYISLCDEDLKSAVRELYGLKKKETLEQRKPLVCPRCSKINEHDGKYCFQCGFSLDKVKIVEARGKIIERSKERGVNILDESAMKQMLKHMIDSGEFSELIRQRQK